MSKQVRKPKFKIGQVVAIWGKDSRQEPEYFRIASFFFDQRDALRYTFAVSVAGRPYPSSLCPTEEILRALTAKEKGH